jgi:hypothetical protein
VTRKKGARGEDMVSRDPTGNLIEMHEELAPEEG